VIEFTKHFQGKQYDFPLFVKNLISAAENKRVFATAIG
jgi:hypothetical protein